MGRTDEEKKEREFLKKKARNEPSWTKAGELLTSTKAWPAEGEGQPSQTGGRETQKKKIILKKLNFFLVVFERRSVDFAPESCAIVSFLKILEKKKKMIWNGHHPFFVFFSRRTLFVESSKTFEKTNKVDQSGTRNSTSFSTLLSRSVFFFCFLAPSLNGVRYISPFPP